MTKVDIIVDNVESSCIPCCEDLHDLLVDAKNKFKQVNDKRYKNKHNKY